MIPDPKYKYNPLRRKMTTLINTHIAAALSSDYDFPYGIFHDGHVMGKMFQTTQKDYDFALKTLYNRATFQIQALHAFKTLRNEGLIAEDALNDYINVIPHNDDISDEVHNMNLLLRCFDLGSYDRFLEERFPDVFFDYLAGCSYYPEPGRLHQTI